MHPVKRPKAGDTEEDILKEAQEFQAGLKTKRVVPAANIVRKCPKESSSPGNLEKNVSEGAKGDEDTVATTPIEHPVETVLFEVRERPFDPNKLQNFTTSEVLSQVLKVQKTKDKFEASGGTRKKSLFARTFDARKEAREKANKQTEVVYNCAETVKVEESHVTQAGKAIGDKIHPYLAGMTEAEILEERRKLLERLDPKLVEFIKSGRHRSASTSKSNKDSLSSHVQMEVDCNQEACSKIEPVQITEKDLPINPKHVVKYPGMNKVELTKLEWTGLVKDGSNCKEEKVQTGKNARFDFSGMLLPGNSDDPTTYERALHNHGEEMERPGYTIEELLTLARSVNMQQRAIALGTLGQIFSKAHTGLYDDVLEKSIFDLMDYIDLIHTARKGLDNMDSNTINASLRCLAGLLYPDFEEDCLDAAHLWPDSRPYPLLSPRSVEAASDKVAETELKDFEFLQLDLLEFFMNRSEILARIEYLVTTKSDLMNETGVTSLLKVLIRLARHSPASVMKYERILKFITENYVSSNWIILSKRDQTLKGIPLYHALKLLRILVDSSVQNAMKLYTSYSVLPSVMSYLAYDQWREQTHVQEVENLVLEAFKIWIGFLSHGIAIDEYLSLFPVLIQFLKFYGLSAELNSFDLHHSSHLFALLTQILRFGDNGKQCQQNKHSHWNLVKDAASSVEDHCVKTMKILASPHLHGTYSLDLAVFSLGKALEFLTCCMKYCDHDAMKRRLLPAISDFSGCNTYKQLTANLKTHSVLLADLSNKSRYPSNFASVGGIQWKGELHPIMRPNSPYHFLKHFVAFTRLLCEDSTFQLIFNSNIQNYLIALQQNKDDFFDFFARFELSCLLEILKSIPNDFMGKFLVAYNSVVFVPSCCENLFQDMLKVTLETCCSLNDSEAVCQFYVFNFLNAKTIEPEIEQAENLSKTTKVKFDDGGHPGDGASDAPIILFKTWTQKIAEKHWIFHPLESLYKRVHSTPGYVKDNLEILEQETRGCLSFIKQCMLYHRDSILQTSQDLVTVYCRICRVFMLGSPNVYIDALTLPLLLEILQILLEAKILKTCTDTIFSKHKPSSSAAVSFYDFYTELVNEYFDNSYFNEVFASYLFLPLRSPEDSNVKTCFWGHEYINCVKINAGQLSISSDYLTQIPEKDQKILTTYTYLLKRNVITHKTNPFLYEIVTTHLRNSLGLMTDKLRSDFESLGI